MRTINPDWVEIVQETVNPCPYFRLQQMILEEIGWGTSYLKIPLENRHMQPFGVVHGGVFASLIDAAGFWAVFSQLDPGLGMTTVDLRINYLAPAKSGQLIGIGRCIKLGRQLGLGEARVESETGQLLAHGTTTVMVRRDLQLPESVRSTAKYIG